MTFQSKLSVQMELFLQQKRALGFSYIEGERILHNFDKFCANNYPSATTVTQEICNAWTIHRESERKGSAGYSQRLTVVREFARFLLRSGIDAFVIPKGYSATRKGKFIPHIFTDEELKLIFKVSDTLAPTHKYRTAHLAAPVMLRLLFACGLRPQEVRLIKVSDINLETGAIKIIESKCRRDRLVVMDDSMKTLCAKYYERIRLIFPKSEYFFPAENPTGVYAGNWLTRLLNRCLKKAGLIEFAGNKPRVYDFRHSFATKTLYRWLAENRDLSNCLPFLSAYMGHDRYDDTAYYIHLVPEFFSQSSGIDFNYFARLLPEVEF